MNASLLATAFGAFVAALAVVPVSELWRTLPRRAAAIGALGLPDSLGQFPFSDIPGLMVPLALILHLPAFRGLRSSTRAGGDEAAIKAPLR